MSELPLPYNPESDVPITVTAQDFSDPRVQAVAERAAGFMTFAREVLPASPYLEEAARYVGLAVQACHTAAQDGPTGATEEP